MCGIRIHRGTLSHPVSEGQKLAASVGREILARNLNTSVVVEPHKSGSGFALRLSDDTEQCHHFHTAGAAIAFAERNFKDVKICAELEAALS